MSAYICDPEHIKALAIYAVRRSGGYGLGHMNVDPNYLRHPGRRLDLDCRLPEVIASYYADTLYQENIRSVQARYPGDTWPSLPGPCEKPEHLSVRGREIMSDRGPRPSAVAILKMCNCLEYQSCETEDYRNTLAFDILDKIRAAAIENLPGYDEAPWGYEGPPTPTEHEKAERLADQLFEMDAHTR